jgi:hypothetical protein
MGFVGATNSVVVWCLGEKRIGEIEGAETLFLN